MKCEASIYRFKAIGFRYTLGGAIIALLLIPIKTHYISTALIPDNDSLKLSSVALMISDIFVVVRDKI